ncbi:MAG: molybdenum cofactor biosynthesis protein MoaE [Actinobacteria bacterium]|nr:molybdenum cofactor biosynthesis protein MoaE [Actinomycetota bacterium]
MSQVRHVDVREGRLDPEILRSVVADASAGATALFTGDVRDNDHGRPVVSLSYEAHPSAKDVLSEVAQEIAERFDVIAVAVAHRHGPIPVGEAALVAAVSARHREEAFAACIALVDLTKERIPIWKHQVFADGTDEWVNCA